MGKRKTDIEEKNIELIYNYAFEKEIYINKIYEQILFEDCEKTNSKLLFHGAKNIINFPLDYKYSKNKMFWIGYIYRALSIIYKLSSREIFKLFNAKKIVTYYNIYHTFDVEQAVEKMMESINYQIPDFEKDAYQLLKKLMIREKLEDMIGQNIKVYVDRQIGSIHPKHTDIIYPINYGYIEEIKKIIYFQEKYFKYRIVK